MNLNTNLNTQVGFNGRYSPSPAKLKEVWRGLNGKFINNSTKKINKDIIGPSFFADKKLQQELLKWIKNPQKITNAIESQLVKAKKGLENTFLLISNKKSPIKIDNKAEAKVFFKEMRLAVNSLDKTMNTLYLKPQEKEIFFEFMSQTATTLHLMGFKNSINHAANVSNLCMVESTKHGAKNSKDILQAAITGWIHDPKIANYISKENLASHPILASSIAKNVLNKSKLNKKIITLFNGDKAKAKEFVSGITEALSINNDSLFVTDKVILNKIKQKLPSNYNEIRKKAINRYWHPSMTSKKPLTIFNKQEETLLNSVSFETGLKGIDKNSFIKAYNVVAKNQNHKELFNTKGEIKSALQVFKEITKGKIKSKKLITELNQELQKSNPIIKDVNINALNLFAHNKEVINGKIAADSLAVADPKMLSLHKTITQNIYPTITKRIVSFIESFDKNIKGLEHNDLASGKNWEENYLKSILSSVNKITNQVNLGELSLKLQTLTQNQRIKTLKKVLSEPNTCKNIKINSVKFKQLVDNLKTNYKQLTQTSEQFNVL